MKCPNKDCRVELILLSYKEEETIKTTWIHPVIAGKCEYQKDGISIYVDDPLLNNAFNQLVKETEEIRVKKLQEELAELERLKNSKAKKEAEEVRLSIFKAKLKEKERIDNLWYNKLLKYLRLK